MSAWVKVGAGTYRRSVARSRADRYCDDCGRVLPAGGPYTEHRATTWSDMDVSRPYSIRTCGPRTSDCEARR